MGSPFSTGKRRVNNTYEPNLIEDEALVVVSEYPTGGYSGKIAFLDWTPLRDDQPGVSHNPRVYDGEDELTEVDAEPAAANQFRVDYRNGRIQFHTSIDVDDEFTVDYYGGEQILRADDFTDTGGSADYAQKVAVTGGAGRLANTLLPTGPSFLTVHATDDIDTDSDLIAGNDVQADNDVHADGNVGCGGDFVRDTVKTLKRVLPPAVGMSQIHNGLSEWGYHLADGNQFRWACTDADYVLMYPIALPPGAKIQSITGYGSVASDTGTMSIVKEEDLEAFAGDRTTRSLGDPDEDTPWVPGDGWCAKTISHFEWEVFDNYAFQVVFSSDAAGMQVGAVIVEYTLDKPLS